MPFGWIQFQDNLSCALLIAMLGNVYWNTNYNFIVIN